VDRVIGYLAPALLGAGPSALAAAGIATIGDAFRLAMSDVTTVGGDLRVTARPWSQPKATKPTARTGAALAPRDGSDES
jgi:diaminohydroxyphosphoribosylaminopyrimidine deaminase/5-amino-6-(5-phosphoribosylamino)uracil reductase